MDERFLLHRYKATSHAAVATAFAIGGYFFYEQFANDTIRYDLMALLGVMAVVKLGFMVWYRLRN
jgi:hypothetical protein